MTKRILYSALSILGLFCTLKTAEPVTIQNKIIITLVQGNLVKQRFQDPTHSAIINAANRKLIDGAGITGAIWKASGDLTDLTQKELEKLKNSPNKQDREKIDSGCLKTGQAVMTGSKNLKTNNIVDWIIHTPGPDCRDKNQNNNRAMLLTSSYLNSLKLADANAIHTIAFPSISTGIYAFPFDEAINIAIETCIKYLLDNTTTTKIKEIRFVMWDTQSFEAYFAKLMAQTKSLITTQPNNQAVWILDQNQNDKRVTTQKKAFQL